MKIKNIFNSIWRQLRRKYYFAFRKDYVKKSIEKRKGKCGRHGCCDDQPSLIKCKSSNGKGCILWKERGYDTLPEECKKYPFDEKDKSEFSKKYCTFHWKDEK
jgi:hypothetical protein